MFISNYDIPPFTEYLTLYISFGLYLVLSRLGYRVLRAFKRIRGPDFLSSWRDSYADITS